MSRDLPPLQPGLPPGLWWEDGDLHIDVHVLLAGMGVANPPPELVDLVVTAAEDMARKAGCALEVNE